MAQRTDTRPLAIRKQSLIMRAIKIREQLTEIERAEAELDTEIENEERAREWGQHAAQ